MVYFLDTYAIIEFLKGNNDYVKYFKQKNITTRLHLMELYYKTLRDFGKKMADKFYAMFLTCSIDFDDDIIKEAMIFRLNMRKKRKEFSYTDCVGYILAKGLGIKFLTGDNEFKGLANVKFIK